MHAYIYIHIHMYRLSSRGWWFMCVYTCMYIHIREYKHMHIRRCIYIFSIYTCVDSHQGTTWLISFCLCIHTYIYIHMYWLCTYIHIYYIPMYSLSSRHNLTYFISSLYTYIYIHMYWLCIYIYIYYIHMYSLSSRRDLTCFNSSLYIYIYIHMYWLCIDLYTYPWVGWRGLTAFARRTKAFVFRKIIYVTFFWNLWFLQNILELRLSQIRNSDYWLSREKRFTVKSTDIWEYRIQPFCVLSFHLQF